jgi:serine O-acetyltransferase
VPLNVCGAGLCLVHGGTIIINGNAIIGKNCRIHSGVNIGSIDSMPDKAPVLGDNIYIGPGAK